MTRIQALIVGVLVGLVVLVFMGLVALLFFTPTTAVTPPTAPATPSPAPSVATPVPPPLLPTPSEATPVLEPTATNTRVPTVTPRTAQPPTPTVVFSLPTPAIRPTATPVANTPRPVILPSPTPTLAPTPIPLQYRISFRAKETTIKEGDCTDLEWEAEGVDNIRLDGKEVNPSGKKEVCPTRDTVYQLTVRLRSSAQEESRTVTISVDQNDDNN